MRPRLAAPTSPEKLVEIQALGLSGVPRITEWGEGPQGDTDVAHAGELLAERKNSFSLTKTR